MNRYRSLSFSSFSFVVAGIVVFFVLFSLLAEEVSGEDKDYITGKVYNDTDMMPPGVGPVPLNIVVDRVFMGRIGPGESMEIALKPRLEPYEVRAYIFYYDGSVFFAEVDLPLRYPVEVPVSHRGVFSPFWVAFEGIPPR